ncbi:AI-2E family transporter [Virgibacillus necropolis]|uniref:AI-2E family transporter n=1 Tax=Virgibacillus necropolis TaxID=163877 RepID=A0A221MC00_9BACI|nr:AI-2E family transporter [Virgibacillus necropolis]ASN05142.1 AI-2E family transporter [Virgibacillus necropolis]
MFKEKNPLHILYWLIIGILTFLLVYLFIKLFPFYGTVFSFLWSVFFPFFFSLFIAYLLYPIMQKIHSFNIPKGLAILIIYVLFLGGIIFAINRIYPLFLRQLTELSDQLPQFISTYKNWIYQIYESTAFLPETVHDKMDNLFQQIETRMGNLVSKLINSITKIFDIIVVVTVIPVLVFYFLKDKKRIKDWLKKWIPSTYHHRAHEILFSIDKSLGNYIRGQLLVSLFVSIATFTSYYFLDLKYALVLAIIMGFTNFIPYFGPIIGALPALAIALTVSTKLAVFVLITVFVIQLIESNFLSPFIVGKSIHIHPIAIIFALLVGGQVGGVVGLLLAVPLLTITNEIVRQFRKSTEARQVTKKNTSD